MTVYQRTNIPLTAGGPIARDPIGAPGFTALLGPSLPATSTTWPFQIARTTATLGANTAPSSVFGTPILKTTGDPTGNAGKVMIPPALITKTVGFTFFMVVRLAAATTYLAELGQYRLAAVGGAFRLEHGSQISQLATVTNTADPHVIVGRCDAGNTTLKVDSLPFARAGTIDATPIPPYAPWIGRTTTYAAGTQLAAFGYAPHALTDAELVAVANTQRAGYPWPWPT